MQKLENSQRNVSGSNTRSHGSRRQHNTRPLKNQTPNHKTSTMHCTVPHADVVKRIVKNGDENLQRMPNSVTEFTAAKAWLTEGAEQSVFDDHYEPTVRLLDVRKAVTGACGFHLTRSKWDPYPWVSAVDAHTPAEMCGLRAGDCVLEVNGEDVLGLRITDIAKLVKAKSGYVTLLLWSSGCDVKCDPENVCCGPMPRSLQRLSLVVQSILSIIECPVCLDSIPPPAMQCQNGHLLCLNCRIRSEKCPVCRDRYTPQRALIAERIYTTITNAFQLCSNEDKLRQKVFGLRCRQQQNTRAELTPIDEKQRKFKLPQPNQHVALGAGKAGRYSHNSSAKPTEDHAMGAASVGGVKRKFLMKLLRGKACSMENLSNVKAHTATAHVGPLLVGASTPALCDGEDVTAAAGVANTLPNARQLCATNRYVVSEEHNVKISKNHLTFSNNGARTASAAITLENRSPATTTAAGAATTQGMSLPLKSTTNNVAQVNGMPKRYSLSTNDLSQAPEQQQQQQQEAQKRQQPLSGSTSNISNAAPIIANERGPSSLRRRQPACISSSPTAKQSSATACLCRQPCRAHSIERIQTPDVDDCDHASMAIHNSATDTHGPPSPASSTSSGVFTALDADVAPSPPPPHPAALSSPSVLVLAAATIKNELLSLSSSTTAAASKCASSLKASGTADDVIAAAAAAPVGVVLPFRSLAASRESSSTSPRLSANVTLQTQPTPQLLEESHKNRGHYRCPCDCDKRYEASSQLQRHVKVEHRLPVVSFGSASAQLALPLHQPLDNAVLILEIPNNKHSNNGDSEDEVVIGTDACQTGQRRDQHESDENSVVKGCSKAAKTAAETHLASLDEYKECWIRLKTQGAYIQIAAMLQAAVTESLDFVLETHLRGNNSVALQLKGPIPEGADAVR